MNTNIQEILLAYHRGIEVGREAARHEMDEFAKLSATFAAQGSLASAISKMAPKNVANPPAKPVAGGTKKATVVRTKGVKETILALISHEPLSPARIISATGFKSTSVRATLMSLKKSGLAMSDDGLWAVANPVGHGNSESEAHA